MKHFKNILICTHPEFTDVEIVDRAARIAKGSGAAVKVMHVIADYPEDMNSWWNVRNPKELHEKIVRERQNFVEGIVERVKAAGVTHIESALRWSKEGQEFLVVVREVLKHEHDLVVITSRRKNRLARLVLECPSLDLFRHCPCALWVTQSQHKLTKSFKRVAATLRGEGNQVTCTGLNAKVLETAASVAESEGSELHIVHALPVYGGHGLENNRLHPDLVAHLEKIRHQLKETANAQIDNDSLKLTDERIHLLAGAPVAVIPDFVSDTGIDLLIMGTVARGGIPGLLVGNTAEKMLDHVECGVLAVKPDDFVSVVTLEGDA